MTTLNWGSRESGIEFAVSWFLLALGLGLLIPRPGLGLYSLLHMGGNALLWSAAICMGSVWLMGASYFRIPWIRFGAVAFAMMCWMALAVKFMEGQLWGATMQAAVAIFLLNACAWRLFRYARHLGD